MLKMNKAETFLTTKWPEVVEIIASAYHFSNDQKVSFKNNKTARLIAAIPFVAGCRQPMRTAVAHVAIYQIARREAKEIFLHTDNDDASIQDRLFEGSLFNGGDKEIIEHGMNLLALQMIRGYAKDWSDDIIENKYNPLVQGTWIFEQEEAFLIKEITARDCSDMDAVMSLDDVDGVWDGGDKA